MAKNKKPTPNDVEETKTDEVQQTVEETQATEVVRKADREQFTPQDATEDNVSVPRTAVMQLVQQNEQMKEIVGAVALMALSLGKLLGGRMPEKSELIFALPGIINKLNRNPELMVGIEAGFSVCLEKLPPFLDEQTLDEFKQTFQK